MVVRYCQQSVLLSYCCVNTLESPSIVVKKEQKEVNDARQGWASVSYPYLERTALPTPR